MATVLPPENVAQWRSQDAADVGHDSRLVTASSPASSKLRTPPILTNTGAESIDLFEEIAVGRRVTLYSEL